jgi:two-component system, NarL family, nitrate/nitrite response regulator NarL
MVSKLSPRRQAVAALVADGYSNKEIARLLGITEGTVKAHLNTIYRMLAVRNRTALAMLFYQRKAA